jgi:hypothetical protein
MEGHRTPEIRMEKAEPAMAPGPQRRTLNSKVARARTAWDVGNAVRHASRALVCSCVASRNSWPTNGTHISWIRRSLRSRRAASIPHNGSSSRSPAYRAAERGCRQAARESGQAGKCPRRKGVPKVGGRNGLQRESFACSILCQPLEKNR